MIFTKKILQTFALHAANDATREPLIGIHIDVQPDYFQLEATNGHTMMRRKYGNEEYSNESWLWLKHILQDDFVISLPDKPISGILYLNKKIRALILTDKAFDTSSIYPNLSECVPSTYTRSYLTYPRFSFFAMTIMQKTFKNLGIKRIGWFPDNWNNDIGATTSIIDNYFFLVMPVGRIAKNMCELCHCQIVDGSCGYCC